MPTNAEEWTNRSTTAQTLASGQPLAPGESAECDMTDPHDVALRDAGHLVPTETDVDYQSLAPEQLKALADQRKLEITGTGASGNVLKADYIAALQAADHEEAKS